MTFSKFLINQMLEQSALSSKRIYSEKNTDDVEVAPDIFQSREDYEANMAFDEARDNAL